MLAGNPQSRTTSETLEIPCIWNTIWELESQRGIKDITVWGAYLCNQPPVAAHSRPILEQLPLRASHVVYDIFRVGVDALNHSIELESANHFAKEPRPWTGPPFTILRLRVTAREGIKW